MKRPIFTTLICLIIASISFSQSGDYAKFVTQADSLYNTKEYKESAAKFKAAFDELDGKAAPNDRYNAACSYALANDIENSFYHLNYLAENPKIKYKNLNHITSDSDLDLLHDDARWAKLISTVEANKQEYEKDLDKPLVAMLDTIHQIDQEYRGQVRAIEKEFGFKSKEVKAHWKIINKADSINLIKVSRILDERGWLGEDIVGRQGNSTLFLVVQHAGIDTQLKYLPMMQEAVKKGNASPSSLALLEDRVALRQGNRQIYGSQITSDKETGELFVSPLIDPENVNVRRAEVGLGTIEQYIANWELTWDVEKHKLQTAKIEAEKK